MEYLELSASLRTKTGNGPARRLRAEGRCPAILYGAKTEPIMMSVNTHEFELCLKRGGGSMAFFNLTVEGHDGGKRLAMVKELQREPVSAQMVHIDFYEVDMQRKLTVKVPVHTVGKCKGVELGGLLQVIRRELEVSCLPSNIPSSIELDIADLDIGEAIHVQDIALADGVEIPHDANFTVITVLSPKKEDTGDEEAGEDLDAGEDETADADDTED